MKLQDGQTVKLTKVLYVPKAVKNILSVSRLVSKSFTIGATQCKMITKKNGVSMILDAKKGQKNSLIFYLKAERYAQKGHEALTNMAEKKMETNDKK